MEPGHLARRATRYRTGGISMPHSRWFTGLDELHRARGWRVVGALFGPEL
jgi:hypothetical protein